MLRGRIGGATIAALGGLLLASSAVVPRWWHGPIQIAGKVIHGKTVHISLLRVTGCNAGDGTCVGLDVGTLFRGVTLATLVITVATAVLAGLLAHASWRSSLKAPALARAALLGAAIAVIGGVATIITLPARFEEIPVGGGAFAFFGGAVAVVVASFASLLRRPKHRAAAPPVDVREILSTDTLAPSSLGRHGAADGMVQSPPRFRPWYEAAAAMAPPSTSSAAFAAAAAAAPATEPGLPPGTAPGLGAFGEAPPPLASAPTGGERWQTEANAGSTQVGVPLGPAPQAPPRPWAAAAAPVMQVHGPTHVGVPVAPAPAAPARSSAPPSALSPASSSAAMIFDVSDVTNPANRLLAARTPAPVPVPVPTPVAKPAEPVVEPTTQPEPAPPVAQDELDPGEEGATLQVERLESSDLLEDLEPSAGAADDAEPRTEAQIPKRPSLPRVPTATTSASLAALAALSKPAHITMADGVMRKLPPPKVGDITQTNPAPACPTCVAPLGWVEKHRRYYCSHCRVYS